jgi:hypothetical protein
MLPQVSTLNMETANSSETSVAIHQPAQRHIPNGSDLYSHRRENLKAHMYIKFSPFNESSNVWF